MGFVKIYLKNISQYSESDLLDLLPMVSPERRELLSKRRQAKDRLRGAFCEILLWQGLSSLGMDISELPYEKMTSPEIREKLGEIISRFKGISEKMGYHIHFTPDEERLVRCDVVKIEQVIYNLINNAINYTGADKQVYVRQINTSEGVIIEVEDTGDGIEEDKIKLIFDKYYRSENHKREVVGTGLGLSIVKAVLKLHNYDYGVRSTIGKGSTFWFRISKEDVQRVQK